MTDKINEGGPAFPVTDDAARFPGMNLRDYFAAKAMQGVLAQSIGLAMGQDPIHIANYAYAMADAMIARKEPQ